MADNFLERHREDYEARKKRWLLKKKHVRRHVTKGNIRKPDDESL